METNDQGRANPVPPPIPGKSPPRPNQAARIIGFLILALAPTPITLATLASTAAKKMDDQTVVVLLVVDVVLSFAGAFGIVGSFTSRNGLRLLLAFAMGLSLCAFNAVISFFTGCLLLIGK